MLCHKNTCGDKKCNIYIFCDEKNYHNIIQIKYSNFIQIRPIEYFCYRNTVAIIISCVTKIFLRNKKF